MTEDDDAPHFMIVPAYVDQAIEAKLDAAFAGLPYTAEDRQYVRDELLAYFDRYGTLPDFTLEKKGTA